MACQKYEHVDMTLKESEIRLQQLYAVLRACGFDVECVKTPKEAVAFGNPAIRDIRIRMKKEPNTMKQIFDTMNNTQLEQPQEPDNVNHPQHYTSGGIECIDAIEAAISTISDPVEAFLTGQVIKYLWRYKLKNGTEDLRKAKWYLDRLIKKEEQNNEDNA